MREPTRCGNRFRQFEDWQSDNTSDFLLQFTYLAYLHWRLPEALGQWCTLNSLLSVLARDTRHLILYTLKSVGEALGEQPHLTGGSERKPGGKTGSSHQLATIVAEKRKMVASQVKWSSTPPQLGRSQTPGSARWRSAICVPGQQSRFCAGVCCPCQSGVGTRD